MLRALAVEMYADGLSTRHIEALFADERGQSLLSRTAVSEITQRLWAEYEAFARRDLSEFEVIYLFVDGIAERLHLGQPARRCLPPGVCWRTAIRYFSTWYQGAMRTRRAAASSSRTCDGAVCPIRCWSFPTARSA
jgi:Transposase, Mutator family